MEKVGKDTLFTVETVIYLEEDKMDTRLVGNTTITLRDGRYDRFVYSSAYARLAIDKVDMDEEFVLMLRDLLNSIVRKVIDGVGIVSTTSVGAQWKK